MAFWHLLLFVSVLGAGLIWTLAYLLRHWARVNREKVAARKDRFRQGLASAARRLKPPRRKTHARRAMGSPHSGDLASPPGGLASLPSGSLRARPTVRETPLPASAPRFGTARHASPVRSDAKDRAGPSPAPEALEREPAATLRGLDAVRSDVRETSDASLGNLTALFDRLERGDLPIEEFLRAAAVEREEAERQIRCLEMLHDTRSELEQDAAYQQARDKGLAAIKCQEWALEFRETLRHAQL
jgi:hypothetical protein